MKNVAKVNLTIDRGATFRHTFKWLDKNKNPINLTGYEAQMQIRADINSSKILASLTTENSRIALNSVSGEISLHLTGAATNAFMWQTGIYDIKMITPSNDFIKLISGSIEVMPMVTRV